MTWSQLLIEGDGILAIETLATQNAATDRPGLCARNLERIARATIVGRDHAAATLAEGATDLLGCDSTVVLRPTDRADVLAATWASRGDAAVRENWTLGPRTRRLFDRMCHTADGWREPWSGLRMKLRGIGVRSWAGAPLRDEGETHPLGLLVVGARREGRPCERMHRLPDLGLSATAALSAAPEEGRALPDRGHDAEQSERLRTVGNLAFGISHTLGNIFGAIIGNLQFLREETASDAALELIERIERSTTDGVELMRSLQDYASMPAMARMQRLDLSETAQHVALLAGRLAGHWPSHRRLCIETDLAETAPAWGDERQVRESVVNVVFNAVQVVGREGTVIIRTGCDGRTGELRVIDDGPGMSDEVRRRATEPFFTTYPALHQGLGLTVARAVAVGHRGSLTLHRNALHGTEVALRLPQDPPADRRRQTAPGGAFPATAGH